MAITMYFYILFFIMATPALTSSNKLLKEKNNAGNYDSEKLGFGLGFSFPSYGIGFGGGSGDSNGRSGQRRDDSGFNFDLGFDLGDGNGYGGGGGSVGIAGDRPNNCRCTCDRGGGISGKSNRKNEGKERNPPSKTVACRPMDCNGNDCGGYSKREDGSSPYWCRVTGKGVVPFWCNGSGDSSGKVLNCEAISCPKGADCGAQGARFVLDVPVWVDRRIEPGHY